MIASVIDWYITAMFGHATNLTVGARVAPLATGIALCGVIFGILWLVQWGRSCQ